MGVLVLGSNWFLAFGDSFMSMVSGCAMGSMALMLAFKMQGMWLMLLTIELGGWFMLSGLMSGNFYLLAVGLVLELGVIPTVMVAHFSSVKTSEVVGLTMYLGPMKWCYLVLVAYVLGACWVWVGGLMLVVSIVSWFVSDYRAFMMLYTGFSCLVFAILSGGEHGVVLIVVTLYIISAVVLFLGSLSRGMFFIFIFWIVSVVGVAKLIPLDNGMPMLSVFMLGNLIMLVSACYKFMSTTVTNFFSIMFIFSGVMLVCLVFVG